MAVQLKSFDFSTPSSITSTEKGVYPWDQWFDGDIWELTAGEDFQTHPLMMERIIRTRATGRRAKVRLRHLGIGSNGDSEPFGRIVLQRTDIVGPSEARKSELAAKRAAKKAAANEAAAAFVAKTGLAKKEIAKPTKVISKRPIHRAPTSV